MTKKKVLILYNKLFHYRIPIFNILSEYCDLTVAYSFKTENSVLSECKFCTLYLPIKTYYKIIVHRENISKLCNNYDVVIAYGDIKWISLSTLVFKREKRYKLFFWSIGVPSSYTRKFGKASKIHYMITDYFDRRADGIILYSDFPIKMYHNRGLLKQKFFVANNTVKVKRNLYSDINRTDIIFIGSLYYEKGIRVLLDQYLIAYYSNRKIPNLRIIGDGEEKQIIQEWIFTHKLEDKIILEGSVYSETKKAELFSKAIVCISPLQAGLSVLECMGYGVSFITTKNAITGGEIYNIYNGINGLLLDSETELSNIILDIFTNKEKYFSYGKNAHFYYWQNRKPEDMALGILQAINYY